MKEKEKLTIDDDCLQHYLLQMEWIWLAISLRLGEFIKKMEFGAVKELVIWLMLKVR